MRLVSRELSKLYMAAWRHARSGQYARCSWPQSVSGGAKDSRRHWRDVRTGRHEKWRMSKTGMQIDNKIEGFRLSPQQERLWLHGQTGAGHCSQCVIRLEGALQTDRLRHSLRTIIAGHEAFRTVFYH